MAVLGQSVSLGCNQLSIYDNIVVDNVSNTNGDYAGDDSGFVSGRVPENVSSHDTATVTNIALADSFLSSATEIKITNNASGNGYYVGWAIKKDSGEIKLITADTDNKDGTHSLTLESAFGSAGTAGTSTFNLYNKTNVGWIWHEADQALAAYAFPRDNLSILDIDATDGSAPEYANIIVGDLTVQGALSFNPNPLKVLTLSADTNLTETVIKQYSVILLTGQNSYAVVLPDTSAIYNGQAVGVTPNTYKILLAKLSTYNVTILRSGTDTIEGQTSFVLKQQYNKMTLISYNGGWLIQ